VTINITFNSSLTVPLHPVLWGRYKGNIENQCVVKMETKNVRCFLTESGRWKMQGRCIIGTGLVDGTASLSPVKRTVPADSTRSIEIYIKRTVPIFQVIFFRLIGDECALFSVALPFIS
jgi:hypothetical protein